MKTKVGLEGYLILDSSYLTWNYVAEILSGVKKLFKVNQLKMKEIPKTYRKKTQNLEHVDTDEGTQTKQEVYGVHAELILQKTSS